MKANLKRLKAALASGVKKLGPDSVALKIGKFLLFAVFFDFLPLDLDNFRDLANFSLFNFLDFLACSTSLLSNPPTSLSPLFFPEACLLSFFLLEADPLPTFLLGAGLLGDQVIFNIEVSGVAILMKP